MIAAVDGVHEGDAVGTVGEAQAHDVRIERERAVHVGGEHQHVRQPARTHDRRLGPHRRARHAFRRRRPGAGRLVRRRDLGRDLDLDQQAGRIAKPEAVALETLGRIEQLDAVPFGALLQIGQVVRVAAEREMMQLLALALHHHAPTLVMAGGLQRERVAGGVNVEAEVRIEPLRRRQVGHREHEMVERMNTEPGRNGRRYVSTDGGHGGAPFPCVRLLALALIRVRSVSSCPAAVRPSPARSRDEP